LCENGVLAHDLTTSLNFNVFQGNAVTHLRCGGNFGMGYIATLAGITKVKDCENRLSFVIINFVKVR